MQRLKSAPGRLELAALDLDFDDAAYIGKKAALYSTLAAELATLAAQLLRIAKSDRRSRDWGPGGIPRIDTARSAALAQPIWHPHRKS